MLTFLAETFDLRKLDKACNVRECHNVPSKKVVIFESDLRTSERKDLVTLHFCNEHYRGFLEKSLEKMGEFKGPWKTLGKKVFEIGYVTY